jgi:4-diphosphocytidyl-2-C-methyl-D-erythritol kinase
MILYPNCKINLGLNIVGKRGDGYHDIETVFLPIPLSDCLELNPATEDSFVIDGRQLDCSAQDNLVVRVLNMLRAEDMDIPPVSIRLTKNIPSGAGLGGGSTDAAFMIKGLNELFSLNLTDAQMAARVGRLGADCPVFIANKPVFAEGKGDVFTPLPVPFIQKSYCALPPLGSALPPTITLSIPAMLENYWLVLVKPNDFISTREAYASVTPRPSKVSLQEILSRPVKTWRGQMTNDFEESVFPTHPVVRGIRDQLYMLGATYAAMSGSGSTVYGLFRQQPLLGDVFAGCFLWQCRL